MLLLWSCSYLDVCQLGRGALSCMPSTAINAALEYTKERSPFADLASPKGCGTWQMQGAWFFWIEATPGGCDSQQPLQNNVQV